MTYYIDMVTISSD